MNVANPPTKFSIPFANSAGAGYIRTVPVASQISVTAGAASWTDGFPPLNFLPVSAGGVPPFGQDTNGILNAITAAIRWQMSGASYPYDATFATAITGYAKGSLIPTSDATGYWFNTVDANTTAPESASGAATGWVPVTQYGVTALTGLAASSITLTSLQAAKERITLAGTLTANISIILPAWLKTWRVTNNCTGSFTVTVKTSAGTGVVVQQAGEAEVYGDGTNILAAVAKQVGTATASGQAVNLGQLTAAAGSYAGMLYGSVAQIQAAIAGYVIELAPAVATTYTFPARSGFTTGQSFVIRNASPYAVTLNVDSGSTFQPGGYTSIVLQPGDDMEFVASASATTHWLLSRGSALRQYYPLVVASGATLTEAVNVSQLQADGLVYAAASGTSSAIVVTRAIPVAAYTTGMRVKFLGSSAWSANTGAVTIAVDGLATVNLYGKNATAMQGGEIVANGYYEAVFIGANFYLTSQVLGGIQIPAATQSNHAVSLGQFTLSDAATGYEKLPDGTIRCWGQTASLAPGATATITLPITYPTAVRRVLATAIVSSGTAAGQSAGVTITSTSVITVTNTGTSTGTCAFFWETSGK